MRRKFKLRKIYNFYKFFYFYHLAYKLMRPLLSIKFNLSKALRKAVTKVSKVKIYDKYKNFYKLVYPIRFKDSSNIKNIRYPDIKNYVFYFLRKNRIFNKGRYSRNRQLYRTGVYWCLWLNAIVVYGLYFLFYRFTFNFGYIWLGMFFLILSTIFGRMFKYNFYNIFYLYKELVEFKNWLSFFVLNIIELLQFLFYKIFGNYFILLKSRKKRRLFTENNYLNNFFMYVFNKVDFFFYLV